MARKGNGESGRDSRVHLASAFCTKRKQRSMHKRHDGKQVNVILALFRSVETQYSSFSYERVYIIKMLCNSQVAPFHQIAGKVSAAPAPAFEPTI